SIVGLCDLLVFVPPPKASPAPLPRLRPSGGFATPLPTPSRETVLVCPLWRGARGVIRRECADSRQSSCEGIRTTGGPRGRRLVDNPAASPDNHGPREEAGPGGGHDESDDPGNPRRSGGDQRERDHRRLGPHAARLEGRTLVPPGPRRLVL